ncbi:MAG: alkaline phosphatase D family protein, partial [Flavobacteriales bacterium]|nr:alkaline phosphatase D family protein [Flavobacteriales bacterium]
MKTIYTLLALSFFYTAQLSAQSDIASRSVVDPALAPFYHGVASGDPLPDRVIIWTRYTPDATGDPVTINWEMATDTGFINVVQNGNMTTQSERDWTVKVDVTGLSANMWYYYRFEYDGDRSLVGRTRTAPTGAVDSLRFAVASCSSYSEGYFHGYRDMSERNDIDAVLHLGDYIYESGSAGSIGRPHEPDFRISELEDYRQRYSQYRLDPDLRCVHQMYPFINIWDDHELANNAWFGGADAHNEAVDGIWEDRKSFAARAFHEWVPFRAPNPNDSIQIYRSLKWGNLVDLFMVDTRIIGRDEQDANAIDDPNRHILGTEQLGWLIDGMDNSTAQWKVLGQQVLMAALEIPLVGIVPATEDAWNGYRAERNNLFDSVLVKDIENLVVLTGDIHTAWANNLEKDGDKVGVEFVTSSITKQNAGLSISDALITAANPHIQYVELGGHGYYILDINQQRVQVDYQWIGEITDSTDLSRSEGPFWQTLSESRELNEVNSASVARPSVSA